MASETWALCLLTYQIPAAAAAAKSLQSCPTLCDPIDGSPTGSPVPGILQARTQEWVAISFSNAWKWKVKVKSLSRAWLLATPWTAAYQAPSSMGFSRQEYWSGLPPSHFPAPSPPSFFSRPSNFPSVPFSLWFMCHHKTLLHPPSLYEPLPNPFHRTSAFQSPLVTSSLDYSLPVQDSWRPKALKNKHVQWKKRIKNRLDVLSTLMSFRDPQTWWILSLLPHSQYTVSIRLLIRAKKVSNVSTTNIFGDALTLILSRKLQLAPLPEMYPHYCKKL